MKKYFSIIIALFILAGTIFFNKKMTSRKKEKKPPKTEISRVEVLSVSPEQKEIVIQVQGVLKAKESIDIVPEVQGIMLRGRKEFKPGTYYKLGETLVSIDPGEFLANLRSLKSNLTGILTAALPDIKMDFPESYDKWLHFLQNIDMNNPLPPLPGFNSDKEKFFITGRKILSTYYQVKNAEIRLSKYRIKAPISGYLSQVMIAPGSMVRPGQKLGILKDLSKYEMEADIPSEYASAIHTGLNVKLNSLHDNKTYQGRIIRVNPVINTQTHTLTAYIEVKSPELKEGMYLETHIPVKSLPDAVEIPGHLIFENNKVFIVKDSILQWYHFQPVFHNNTGVLASGIPKGTLLVTEALPAGKAGSKVIPIIH